MFNFTSNLKDLNNDNGDSYYVRIQLPEPLASAKKEQEDKMRQIRKKNEQIPEEEKHKRQSVSIKSNVLYINKIPQCKFVTPPPPTVQDVFNCDKEITRRMEKIKFVHSAETINKRSRFVGHVARVANTNDVTTAYKKIKLLFSESDHIMLAYSVKNYEGWHDDGEHAAGSRIIEILSHS